MALLALAAGLALAAWLGTRPGPPAGGNDDIIATLESGKSCKWAEGTLPTQVGAQLRPGKLRLAEGLARIAFTSGAEITLQGPAALQLDSARHCTLLSGRLTARVPPRAAGFVVETPTATLTDQGTDFGVNVREDNGTADVSVFEGAVDTRHRTTKRERRMTTGQRFRFDRQVVRPYDPHDEEMPPSGTGAPAPRSDAVRVLSTAMGRGKDGYVQPVMHAKHRSDVLLLVKNTSDEKSEFNRKAYLTIDLASLKGVAIGEARLTFTFAPTGMGFAAEVPDATFAVYGLTDEALDGWDDKALSWKDAPANRPGGAALDESKVELLGTFVIAQGENSGTRGIEGEKLARFLRRDTNGLATFILVRQTPGSGRSDLVHGFANRHHPHLRPPTLEVSPAAAPDQR